ncbi:MAG: iron-sulfur cluster assembly accessory protein [Vampirovibrionales bacterium]|nr:iron-sulfur cluster assembly accessory protein [Vampirovibrionales bacterium]
MSDVIEKDTPENKKAETKTSLIDVTEAAANKLQAAIDKFKADNPTAQKPGIKLGVLGGGCAGLQYDLKPVDGAQPGDLLETFFGVEFYIHPMVLPYLKGTTLDYSDDLMEGGFKFKNPNAASSCGCGTSFGL